MAATTVTRRSFLQLSGVVAIHTSLMAALPASSSAFDSLFAAEAVRGRTLQAADVYSHSQRTRWLWPDSVVRIYEERDGQYRIDGGGVDRTAIQPMMPSRERVPFPATPFIAEVVGPVAAIRRACAADAPLVTRIGHGGAGQVIGTMPDVDGSVEWLELAAADGARLGWTQAVHWQPVDAAIAAQTIHPTFHRTIQRIDVDMARGQLTAYQEDRAVLQTAVSASVRPGQYALVGRNPVVSTRDADVAYEGVPWAVTFEGMGTLAGAYWHNRFGMTAQPGPAIQVPPLAARWLYEAVADGAELMVG